MAPSSWAESRGLHLAATAVASGALVATALLSYQNLQRQRNENTSKLQEPAAPSNNNNNNNNNNHNASSSFSSSPATAPTTAAEKEDLRTALLARRAQAGDYDESLILEQLARNRAFLTPAGLDALRSSFVVVVGCGGVGSHATAALARSGVERLRVVDFDQVTLSSLNRHAVATLADVGSPKTRCLARRLGAVAPWCRFEERCEKFWEGSQEGLLGPWMGGGGRGGGGGGEKEGGGGGKMPDFVIDAIDNIDTKVSLLAYCHSRSIPVISAMGAGCKSDPTRIMVGDISTSTDDRLSRAVRRRLKLRGIVRGIPTVFSTEKSGEGKAELLPLDPEELARGGVGDLAPAADFRVRILPVLGTMPAVFGYTAANHVILSLTGYPSSYAAAPRGRDKMYEGVLAAVHGGEEKMVRHLTPGRRAESTVGLRVPVLLSDVAFLVDDVWGARSAVTGLSTRLTLTRWRRPEGGIGEILVVVDGKGFDDEDEDGDGEGREKTQQQQKSTNLKLGQLVCMTKEEAARHDREVLRGDKSVEEVYDAETIERVERGMREARGYEAYR